MGSKYRSSSSVVASRIKLQCVAVWCRFKKDLRKDCLGTGRRTWFRDWVFIFI